MFWDHKLTIFAKYQSVRLPTSVFMCEWQKIFVKCCSRANALNFMKLYIYSYANLNWFLSSFNNNCSTVGPVVILFPEFLGYAYLDFYLMKLYKNLCTTYMWLEVTMVGAVIPFSLQILVTVLSRIWLHEIVKKICMHYTYFKIWHWYKIYDYSCLESAVVKIFPEFLG